MNRLKDANKRLMIDINKIYAIGFSNGGMFGFLLSNITGFETIDIMRSTT